MKWFQNLSKKKKYGLLALTFFVLWMGNKVHTRLKENSSRPFLSEPSAEAKEENPAAVAVRVVAAEKKTLRQLIPVQGTVTGTKIQLRFETAGVLKSLDLQPGKKVQKGDILASLDDQDALLKIQYRQAKQEAAQSQLTSAQNKLEMFTNLFETGYLLAAKLEEIRLEQENKEKELQAARLEVESANREYEKLFLRSPCDGVIAEKESAVGEFVPAGTKVGTLIDTADLYLELNITERYLDKIGAGQKVKFSAHSSAGVEHAGVVEAVVPVVEGKSRTLTAKVRLENPDKRLIPGVFVRGWVSVCEKNDVLAVPASLIQREQENPYVLVVTSENKISRRAVKLGIFTQEETEVLEGLSAGDLLVKEPMRPFQEGDPVRVVYENR